MSIWSVQCLTRKFIRHAYILANRRILGPPPLQPPPPYAALRSSHSSLYQMVKKRTFEARTKLQAKKYPNQQVCIPKTPYEFEGEPDADAEATANASAPCFPNVNYQAPPRSEQTFVKGYAEYKQVSAKEALKSSEVEDDSEELVLDTCKDPCEEFKRKRQETRCPPSAGDLTGGNASRGGGARGGGAGGGGAGACNGDGSDTEGRLKDLRLKCLLGALAALLAGGLVRFCLSFKRNPTKCILLLQLSWFLTRKPDDSEAKKAAAEEELRKRRLLAGLITSPENSADLPEHVEYLIVGAGTAAFSACRAIKSNDSGAKVLMISNENRKPYMRPPLSKELWYTPNPNEDPIKDYRFQQWTGSERSLFFEPEEYFVDPEDLEESAGGVAVAQGFAVKKVDAKNRKVTLNDGYQIGYDNCLIATGCVPKNLTIFHDAPPSIREKVMVYRTPDDFDRLRKLASQKRSITIVGNGFVGSELACSLAHYSRENGGGKVYQVFEENGNMSRVLPSYLSRWTMAKMEAQGVCIIPNASIRNATRDESNLKLELNNGMTLMSDVVVVCVGSSPNTELAAPSSLEVDSSRGGFVVNAELEARRNLYVAGDVSCFYDPLLGRRRVEHHDHSVVSGRLAGENMTGAKKPYQHQSMFWSDLGPEIGYEGVGLVDSSLPTVGVFALPSDASDRVDNLAEHEDSGDSLASTDMGIIPNEGITCDPDEAANYGKGVVFYMKDDKVVGILLWNLFNRIGLARTIINQNKNYDNLNEVAKLFEINA
ncbi:hypothetical protein KR032_001609 [Drosophila birchii]|nr:hypothetical protein KR032_001609 [Drosophila birchii]